MVLAAFFSTCSHLACSPTFIPLGGGVQQPGIEPGSPDLWKVRSNKWVNKTSCQTPDLQSSFPKIAFVSGGHALQHQGIE